MKKTKPSTKIDRKPLGQRIRQDLYRHWGVYVLAIPMVLFYLIFCYFPMYGAVIAFQDYNPWTGFAGSEWVGFKHFVNFFEMPAWTTYVWNTLRISLTSLLVTYPLTIVLALAFNNLPNRRFRKTSQTIFYMPHFVSVVVLIGIIQVFTNNEMGAINRFLGWLGMQPIDFSTAEAFLPTYILSSVWTGIGWGTILYTSTLTAIPPELYEAAMIDGASKMQRVRYIDLPALMPVLSVSMIMSIGGLLGVGYEKVLLMQTANNISVSEILSSYTYKVGILGSNFSFSAAIGFISAIVNSILMTLANFVSKKLSGSSLW